MLSSARRYSLEENLQIVFCLCFAGGVAAICLGVVAIESTLLNCSEASSGGWAFFSCVVVFVCFDALRSQTDAMCLLAVQLTNSVFISLFPVCERIFAHSVPPGGAGHLRAGLDRTRESIVEKVDALGYGLGLLPFFSCVRGFSLIVYRPVELVTCEQALIVQGNRW